uniref:EF-hand domain-containing protein n=1 Tax=Ficedula albicollis TaxID=59894 RepID=A0A803V7W3_FICAL
MKAGTCLCFFLFESFEPLLQVDKDRSGIICDNELQQALSNGKGWDVFLPLTN